MTEETKQKIQRISTEYGYDAQSRQCIEEMAELTQAVIFGNMQTKVRWFRCSLDVSALAQVEIVMLYMTMAERYFFWIWA